MIEYVKNPDGTVNRVETKTDEVRNIVVAARTIALDDEIAVLTAKIAALNAEKIALAAARHV